jgi:hypothetical protein
MNKKGFSLQEMAPLAISFVIIAIVLGIGATVVASIQATQGNSTSTTIAYNASGNGLTSLNTLASWLPTIAVIIAAAVVIGIIVAYFRFG